MAFKKKILLRVKMFDNVQLFSFYIKPSSGQRLHVMYILNYIQF